MLESVKRALAESGLPAQRLALELNEATLMPEPEPALVLLRKLDALGARIAICGFGSAASSLSALRRFPARKLRITSYNVCYTKLLRDGDRADRRGPAPRGAAVRAAEERGV